MAFEYQVESDEVLDHIKQVINNLGNVKLFGNSVHDDEGDWLFMIKEGAKRYLIVVPEHEENSRGKFIGETTIIGSVTALKCDLNHENAEKLRSRFEFVNAKPIGNETSVGFEDWFGLAGSLHLRIAEEYGLEPILAQQSIRELEKINYSAEEVMDAATWAVFQNGYHKDFGANADHLRSTDEIDKMVALGYSMFSIELSDLLINEVEVMSDAELETALEELPWIALEDRPESLIERILESEMKLESGFEIKTDRRDVLEGMVKNGNAIAEAKRMSNYLKQKYSGHPAELEISFCEAVNPMTIFEHYLISSELHRLGVDMTSFAPCFQKSAEMDRGIKDDDQFREDLRQHLGIANLFGQYKLSFYATQHINTWFKTVAEMNRGAIHVKTFGTSYLAALKTLAARDNQLFNEILNVSLAHNAKHSNGEMKDIHDPERLIEENEIQRLLLSTYEAVLSENQTEDHQFRERIIDVLSQNEELYHENLFNSFK